MMTDIADPMTFSCKLLVLYEDACVLAVDKPSGCLVHRGWGKDRVVLSDLVRDYLGEGPARPIHRLDRQTSGVVLFAKDSQSAAALGEAFNAGDVIQKRYLALVRGVPALSGFIDHAIPRREGGPRVAAQTAFRRLASVDTSIRTVSWVEAIPKTGRLHQVRRHLKHISHPIIGDANYGKGPLNRAIRDAFGLSRLALHAASVLFPSPRGGQSIEVCSPVPLSLKLPLLKMGFDDSRVN